CAASRCRSSSDAPSTSVPRRRWQDPRASSTTSSAWSAPRAVRHAGRGRLARTCLLNVRCAG
ncbi:MAG: hypothetical protein AVDCRST_MAG35-1973, partial [uncultured Quadrisphaera sp.]